jgi:hypothetical protein
MTRDTFKAKGSVADTDALMALVTTWESDASHRGFTVGYRQACDHHASALRATLATGASAAPHCNGHTQFEYDCIDCSDALKVAAAPQGSG